MVSGLLIHTHTHAHTQEEEEEVLVVMEEGVREEDEGDEGKRLCCGAKRHMFGVPCAVGYRTVCVCVCVCVCLCLRAQASLGRFGTFFGQQMRNATDSFNQHKR